MRIPPRALTAIRGWSTVTVPPAVSQNDREGWRPGDIVLARGRAWLVLADSDGEVLQVRAVAGSGDDDTCIVLALEAEPVARAAAPPPPPPPPRAPPPRAPPPEATPLGGQPPSPPPSGSDCPLPRGPAQKRGPRRLRRSPPDPSERLRQGIEDALSTLGRAFLAHPQNDSLRSGLQNGTSSSSEYFRQLLRLVHRLVFLLTVEERELLHPPDAPDGAKAAYARGYAIRRLRERASARDEHDWFCDLWESVKVACRALVTGEPRLGLTALGGIFDPEKCRDLDIAKLENRSLLSAIHQLAWWRHEAGIARVNWRDMGPEELGSVYEALLELVPQVATDDWHFSLTTHAGGNARRSSGSYYTPAALVQIVLDRALEPVVAETVARHPDASASALLELSVVDPACGSGHFLLAAARRLAMHVARLEAGDAPSPPAYHRALRQVVSRCIYGVDLNPIAVELCRVSLWMEAAEPGLPLDFLDSHIQHGNALLGTSPEQMRKGIPDAAWYPVEGDDWKTAAALEKRNRKSARDLRDAAGFASLDASSVGGDGIRSSEEYRRQKLVADAWCAAFVWPKCPGPLAEAAPTTDLWQALCEGRVEPATRTVEIVRELTERHVFFHWHLQFPQVFARGGFDVVLGNPPWIAHAGRAVQPLPPGIKQFYESQYEAFGNYPTTHGLFAGAVPRVLRRGGRLGLVLPSSLSELDGYTATRTAHDRLCEFTEELVDFGEGRFPGVTQPCMALVSRRVEGGRGDDRGRPWPVARPDLNEEDRGLLAYLASLPTVPPELFGERGVQSDKALLEHFVVSGVPVGRFTTPIREGTDVREFELLAPRYHVDPRALGGRMRASREFQAARVLIRQTARYPIAAVSDGVAFRNSLVAGFELPGWPADAVAALLNSALIRWMHYMRFRDARQPIMPQVKIAHLRAISVPGPSFEAQAQDLASLGRQLAGVAKPSSGEDPAPGSDREAAHSALRAKLDRVIAELYGLNTQQEALVRLWHDRRGRRRTDTRR